MDIADALTNTDYAKSLKFGESIYVNGKEYLSSAMIFPRPYTEPFFTNFNADRLIFNVGGSVWAMDWCSVAGERKRYIAVGGYRGNSEEHHTIDNSITHYPPGDTGSLKNCVQIWSLEPSNESSSDGFNNLKVKLEMVLVHERGPVFDILWVNNPEYSTIPQDNKESMEMLGLLAVSFGDGAFSVICVPRPSSFRTALKLEEDTTLYLRQVRPFLDAKLPNTKLWKLGWDRKSIIATGCSNGRIKICKVIAFHT